jgi:predicted Zn-dependent protease with MMP-like domain
MGRSEAGFRERVARAMDLVPAEFRPWLDNVEIVVEDWPDPEVLEQLGIGEDEALYGLYQGTPLTERTHDEPILPDRIVLYRRELELDFPAARDLEREVAITVLHELAHHMGLDEARLRELGLD